MSVEAGKTTIEPGNVTFGVKNDGATIHGLAIVKAPASVNGGVLDDATFLSKGEELSGGGSGTVSADLRPGSYELVCFIAGH